jgi:hypothetical protein
MSSAVAVACSCGAWSIQVPMAAISQARCPSSRYRHSQSRTLWRLAPYSPATSVPEKIRCMTFAPIWWTQDALECCQIMRSTCGQKILRPLHRGGEMAFDLLVLVGTAGI